MFRCATKGSLWSYLDNLVKKDGKASEGSQNTNSEHHIVYHKNLEAQDGVNPRDFQVGGDHSLKSCI